MKSLNEMKASVWSSPHLPLTELGTEENADLKGELLFPWECIASHSNGPIICITPHQTFFNCPYSLSSLCPFFFFKSQFGGEPLSYTRFSLARQVDGDNSHVEMKLAVDEEENVDNNMRGNHTNVTKPKRLNGYICYGTIAVIVFFLIGKNGHSKLKCSLSPTLGILSIQLSKHLFRTFLCAIVQGTRNTMMAKTLYLPLRLTWWEKRDTWIISV